MLHLQYAMAITAMSMTGARELGAGMNPALQIQQPTKETRTESKTDQGNPTTADKALAMRQLHMPRKQHGERQSPIRVRAGISFQSGLNLCLQQASIVSQTLEGADGVARALSQANPHKPSQAKTRQPRPNPTQSSSGPCSRRRSSRASSDRCVAMLLTTTVTHPLHKLAAISRGNLSANLALKLVVAQIFDHMQRRWAAFIMQFPGMVARSRTAVAGSISQSRADWTLLPLLWRSSCCSQRKAKSVDPAVSGRASGQAC